ncbi:uncharacterized protein RAG0_05233 [Rhynchosporium agropyri]|uniref:Heterokaryon incompatibility domain-containing protein n=1 Tax=Rhynchosporium agropyri TaxID=914238 RepID=A0A1E1KC99_9HELO|nr:uncharacterized protein RAG0_05233 [Rhynchosporium agropyri]
MWLLDTSTLALRSFMGDDLPPNAILSHTWSDEEVSLQDILNLQIPANGAFTRRDAQAQEVGHQNRTNLPFDFRGAPARKVVLDIQGKAGYHKIERCCAQAFRDGYKYVWVDTCCRDKTNSSELSETINSILRW